MIRLSWMQKWTAAWMAVALILTVCGCAEKLTYQRFQMIQVGDSSQVVDATLGEPWHKTEPTWVYNDVERDITVRVYFEDGKVSGKRWDDPVHGSEGSNPRVSKPGDSEKQVIREIK